MNPDDRALTLAARIADGSGIDWPTTEATPADVDERALLEELKAIAEVATLHRSPTDWPTDAASLAGTRWGPLTLLTKIGEGRFGCVYAAWDARLQRRVALKLLHTASPATSASPTSAIEEARLLARVRHPNVLAVYGAESVDGQVGIWTEFIEGRTLESLLAERGPLPPEDVVAIGLDLCRALAAVHEAGLLHRDVKAQNVMRETGGRIILMDFGTGHDLEHLPPREGDLSGTPLYLAPEILTGGRATPASDVYALAVLLFRLLTGDYPVPGQTLDDVRAGHRAGSMQRLGDMRPNLPATLVQAIDRGLAPDPSYRYDRAAAFATTLELSRRAFEPTPDAGIQTSARLSMIALGFVSLILIGALVAGVVTTLRWRQPSHTTSALETPPATPEVRIVRLPVEFGHVLGRPSHDGRALPYVDTTGNIEVWEVATGKSRRVTDSAGADGSVTHTLLSPTADRVGYVVASVGQAFSLHLVNADGTWPRVLVGRETAFEPIPMDWSRDGRLILCWLKQKDGTSDLVLVPVDGTAQKLLMTVRTPPSGAPPTASLSPDGRFVAYFRARADARPPGKSLFIVSTDGSAPRAVVDGDLHDDAPMWLPNGTGLLFLRDTPGVSESFDAWTVAMLDGVVHGAPRLHASRLGFPFDVALSDDGALYDAENVTVKELYTAAIDLTGRTPIGPPTRISHTELGQHTSPAYSPDGKSVAYFTTRASLPGWNPDRTLTIGDVQSGAARKLDLKLGFIDGWRPRWLPNSKSLVIWAADDPSHNRFGYFRIDTETGAVTPVLIFGPDAARPFFQCSLDGRALLYADPKRGIVSRDFSTGDETTLISARKGYGIGSFALAPRGGAIALMEYVTSTGSPTGRVEVQMADGTRRTLGTGTDYLRDATWAPDGRTILVLKEAGSNKPDELWSLPVSGAEAQDLHFAVARGNSFTLSPSGQQVAYGESDNHWELRVREGFLRGLELAQPGGR
jgi:Tol biopolymer transport system component